MQTTDDIVLVDTHAHLNDADYDHDRDAVLARARDAGLCAIVDFGDTPEASAKSLALAQRCDMVYCGVGIHPNNVVEPDADVMDRLAAMARSSPKVVAIGEIGLDYHWEKSPAKRQQQQRLFTAQLDLARQLRLPVCIHDRDAHGDTMAVLRDVGKGNRGVIHCYSGSWEMARELLDLGWYLGVDGPITYSNAKKHIELVKKIPLDRLLLETDCPYLSPVPYRGQRNEPGYVRLTAQCVADILGLDLAALAAQTTQNAKTVYHIS